MTSAVLAAISPSGCDAQNHFVPQALNQRWTSRGFSAWASPPWIEAGFDPQSAEIWRNTGFSVQQAAAWRRVSNSPAVARAWIANGFLNTEDVIPWVQAFSTSMLGGKPEARSDEAARLRGARISSAEVMELTRAGVYSSNVDAMLKIKALAAETASIDQAEKYSKEVVQPGGVLAFERAKSEHAALFREAPNHARPSLTKRHL